MWFKVEALVKYGTEAVGSNALCKATSSHGPIVEGHLTLFIPPHAVSGGKTTVTLFLVGLGHPKP